MPGAWCIPSPWGQKLLQLGPFWPSSSVFLSKTGRTMLMVVQQLVAVLVLWQKGRPSFYSTIWNQSMYVFFIIGLTLVAQLIKKKSACNAGDPSSISGLGISAGGRIGYPLQYSWASLVAQMVNNHLQCSRPGFDPWVGKRIPWTEEPGRLQSMGLQRVEQLSESFIIN